MRHILLVVFMMYSSYTQAQTYEGTIGKHQIFLELEIDDNDDRANAFYFYKTQLKNISLDGTYNGSELFLYEKHSEIEDGKELFSLSIKNDTLSGTWQNNEHELNVELTETTEDIENYKLQNLEFVRDSISKHDTKELVWFTEKHSKKMLFRVGNGFTKPEREFMNQKLDSIHTRFAAIALECGWADIDIEIELVSNQYISFSEFSSIYCGGAHPSHNSLGYNFDFKNKIQLDKLTDIYPNLNHYLVLKKKYDNDSEQEIECEYFSGKELWEFYSWVLTKEGVTITPSYPHAMASCEDGFPLTYKELQENK